MNERLRRAAPWLLGLAVAAAWANSVDAPFVYDDKVEVVGNPAIRDLGRLDAIAGYNTSRPLLLLTYALNWAAGGLDPRGYHLVSIGIHALNAVLAWRVLGRLLPPLPAFAAALGWAVHPMTTESVTYVTGRSDALCATFWLLAMGSWIDHLDGKRGPWASRGWVVAALLTKEVAVGLPLVLAALAWVRGQGARARSLLGFVGLVGLAAGVRVLVYGWPEAEVARGAGVQLLTQAEAWTVYLRLWLLPLGQSILHDHPARASWQGGLALVGWVAALSLAWRRGGTWAVVAAWWTAVLVPSSLVPLKETLAEHRAYLAGLALWTGLATLWPPRAGLLLVAPLFGLTVARNHTWRDEVRLWADAASKNPASADAWYGWADAARLARDWRTAEAGFREVIRLRPEDTDARVNLGLCLVQLGRSEEARAEWLAALRVSPRACEAHNNLAALDFRKGDLPEAARGYASTLRWCPDDPIALANLGDLFWMTGDQRRAIETWRRYLERHPDGPDAPRIRARVGAAIPR